jgi:hypothetical protein
MKKGLRKREKNMKKRKKRKGEVEKVTKNANRGKIKSKDALEAKLHVA